MELLRYFEAFLIIFLSLLPSLLDVGVQVWNVVSVNTMFKHTKCKDPTGSIAHGQIYCDGDSRSLVCDVECIPGYVPSYGGSRSVCTHGDWSTGVEKMHCDQGLGIIAGGSLQGVPSDIVEVYGPDGFSFPNLPKSSIFTVQSGELIDATDSTLEYVGDDVLLCGSDNLYSSSSQQEMSDHCLGVRRQEEWRLHSALRKNRTQALSTVLKNRLILLAGDEESNNSTEYLNPGSLEWRDGFSLDHPISGACVEKFNRSSFVVVEYTRGVTIYNLDSGIENVIGSENIIEAPTNMDPSTQFDCKVFQRYSRTLLMLVQGGSKTWTMDFDSQRKTWIKVTSQFTFSPTVHLEIFDGRVHVFGETKNVWSYNADRTVWEKSLNTLASQRRNYTTAVIPRTWFTELKHVKEDADDDEEEDSNLKGKILFSIYFSENFSIDVTYVGFISIILVQLPGFCLAFYGIVFAFVNNGCSKAALIDILWSILFIFFPFFLVEILALFEIMFVDVLTKATETMEKSFVRKLIQNVLKNNINNNKNTKTKTTKLMYLEVTKVYFGSCLQFCFQAILYFGYTSTEDQSITQVLSLVSSGITIIKVGTDAFIFQRKFGMKIENEETKKDEPGQSCCASIRHWTMDKKAFVIEKIDKFKDGDKRTYFIAKLKDSMRFLSYVPLVATGAIFHMGCLILSSLVMKEFVVVYIIAVFLSNLVCVFFPLSFVERGLDRFSLKSNDQLKYAGSKAKNDEQKIQEKKISKGLYMCWSNIFMTSRIIENISYKRYIHFLNFQPIHFIINIIVLITCVSINPSTITGATSGSLAAAGMIHIALLFWTFYQQFLEKGKRKAEADEDFRNLKLKRAKGCFTCGIFAKKVQVKEGSNTESKASKGKTETRVNIQQNK